MVTEDACLAAARTRLRNGRKAARPFQQRNPKRRDDLQRSAGGNGETNVDILDFFDSIRKKLFHETQHYQISFHNFYHRAREIRGTCEELLGGNMKHEIMLDFGNDNWVLWGFPWNGEF
ncbi:hypothetical protein CRG98_014173 [Punica granatum]|uniref:Uncharacterized protein n=1 Tax=Punica granatum TaxID=22663 RepID=A0A2I0KA92_PUNGR|nr:hypothetical protein CRG98_014173 [Punica granatum]